MSMHLEGFIIFFQAFCGNGIGAWGLYESLYDIVKSKADELMRE